MTVMRKTFRNFPVFNVITLFIGVVILLSPLVAGAETLVTDEIGNRVQLSIYPPKRIISLAPNITEILYAIGAESQIVGVTDYCKYPPQAQKKEKVGSFITPNLEKIVYLKPDLVIISADSNMDSFYRQMERLHIKTYVINPDTIEKTLLTIQDLGKLTGHPKKASRLVKELQARITKVSKAVQNRNRPKVFFLWSEEPLISAGKATFTHDLIQYAGGINVAGNSSIKYPKYSLEEVIQANPDIVITASMDTSSSGLPLAKEWAKFTSIKAVSNHQIYAINPDFLARPGPTMISGLEILAKTIHPEAFRKK